ncbi:discoidin domain-containing protein [Methylobacterium oxalidis]|uniref:discoidin domain-containing protein n=1 Tax=Methylobacterium oxalidis TaxID=944322 RepID=UPI0033164681
MNLALNKPALQSSVSVWSLGCTVSEDAKGANNGDLGVDYGFHTDLERDPWWQVDLEDCYTITTIKLHNRRNCASRLVRFSILLSLDGLIFDLVYSKSDDELFGDKDELPYIINLNSRISARFLRVRLDGRGILHFRELEAFGTKLSCREIQTSPLSRPDKNVLFSMLFNEDDAFLSVILDNFLSFTDDNCYLFVNLPPGRSVHPQSTYADGRIVIFNGITRRNKLGHTLLLGHIEALEFAKDNDVPFDYFCPLASNSLFGRAFDLEAVVSELRAGRKAPIDLDIEFDINLDINNLPDSWWWYRLKKDPAIIDYLFNELHIPRVSQNQIEGLFSSAENWGKLREKKEHVVTLADLRDGGLVFPLEEMLPVTFFLNFGDGLYTNICHVFWSRFRSCSEDGVIQISELAQQSINFPAHICSYKWFRRDIFAAETAAVAQSWSRGLIRNLDNDFKYNEKLKLLSQRMLLENFAASLRATESFSSIESHFCQEASLRCKSEFLHRNIQAVRQIVNLGGQDEVDGSAVPGFLFMEDTRHFLDLRIVVGQKCDSHVHLFCRLHESPVAGAHEKCKLEGYLYLGPMTGCGTVVFRFRVDALQPVDNRKMAVIVGSKIVLHRCGRYSRAATWQTMHNDLYHEFYYRHDTCDRKESIWFGIPIFSDMELSSLFDIMWT